jgi:hypothetical protein
MKTNEKMKERSFATRMLRFAGLTAAWYLGVVVTCFAIVTLASKLLGCGVDEGSAHACLVTGVDVGVALYMVGMLVVAGVFAMPLLLVPVVGALLLACAGWLYSRWSR